MREKIFQINKVIYSFTSERAHLMELTGLGFDHWFEDKFSKFANDQFNAARITAVNKSNYLIKNNCDEINAELSGKFMFEADSSLSIPTVGDWVAVQYFNDDNFAIIHHILPRKSLLKRKDSGKSVDFQLIASNIDTAFIMQSLDSNFNINRLERYLVMINESNIEAAILLSKSDLITELELSDYTELIGQFKSKYKCIPFSNTTGHGIAAIQKTIKPGKTYCLLGSSGVGKSTLINTLVGQELLNVNTVRVKDDRGRHTTTVRQLIMLEQGGMMIDTPGMRELGNFGIEEGLSETFDDIYQIIPMCKFKNCSHTSEKGCAVLEAVKSGQIDEAHYKNFLKIMKESAYYEMSYLEKIQKDKKFGKLYKQVMKDKKMKKL